MSDAKPKIIPAQSFRQAHGDVRSDPDFVRSLQGYSLTTAEILYRMPDFPDFLQTFVWQKYDMYPQFPVLKGFLEFWNGNLDGALHSVRVAHSQLIKPREIRGISEFRLN